MFQFIRSKLLGTSKKKARRDAARTSRGIRFEGLEVRQMMSATAPAAPGAFTASAGSATEVNLSWHDVAGATGYQIDEWRNGAWTDLGTVGGNSSRYQVQFLAPGTTYYFDVAALNSAGASWAPYQAVQTSTTVQEPALADIYVPVITAKLTIETIQVPIPTTSTYTPVKGTLFGANGPVYSDVHQGGIGDCWLEASLAEVAARDPSDIRNMFTYDGTTVEGGSTVGVYTVRLYDPSGAANYYTVDTELPTDGFADTPANGVLWVALAEKAYAEANGAGQVTTFHDGFSSYSALNIGCPSWALQAITGQSTSDIAINPASAASAWNAGKFVVFTTGSNPASSEIIGDHCYAMVGYNPASSVPFSLYNPWGEGAEVNDNGVQVYGNLFYANGTFVAQNFNYEFFGTAAAPEMGRIHGGAFSAPSSSDTNSPARSATSHQAAAANITDAGLMAYLASGADNHHNGLQNVVDLAEYVA